MSIKFDENIETHINRVYAGEEIFVADTENAATPCLPGDTLRDSTGKGIPQ